MRASARVGDGGRGDEQVEVEFALQTLPHDLHVQEPEEPAAEAEPKCLRRLGLVEKRGVVELEPLEGVAEGAGWSSESVGNSPANTIGLTSLYPGNGSVAGRLREVSVSDAQPRRPSAR